MSQQLVFGDGASILLAGGRLPYLTEIQLAFSVKTQSSLLLRLLFRRV
jgi:hypothetical protein